MNHIPQLQNSDEALRYMRARQEIWARAADLLVLQVVLTVGIPALGAALGLLIAEVKPYAAAAALIITVLDVVVLDRIYRTRLRTAARVAEQFDCLVLQIPRNPFVVGKPVNAEVVSEAADGWLRRKTTDEKLRDWYPTVVGSAPLHLARVICQRTNLWYDAQLRRHYGTWLLTLAGGLSFLFFLSAMVAGLTIDNLVLLLFAPAAPVLVWSLREFFRQKDAADAQESLRTEAEALWDRARQSLCKPEECGIQSRAFQDAIFARRSTSPLVFPGVYGLLRPKLERQMNQGAAEMLADAGYRP